MKYFKLRKRFIRLISVCLTLATVFLCACSSPENTTSINNDEIRVTVLDVGQGDSIFIELTDKRCMLIDAGESEYGKAVTDYISSSGYDKIDYLVATHPHADHIGGMSRVVSSFDIGKVYMPRAAADTKTYENLLSTIDKKGLRISTAKAGVNILNEDSLKIDILAPNSADYAGLNNYSAVIKITFGSVKFLFMGDAEAESENEIKADVSADFVKIGHHGSNTSSSEAFVRRVGAKYAAVSVAEENDYNLPVTEIINRWRNSGAQVLMTKDVGNIVARSDGNYLTVNGETVSISDGESGTAVSKNQTQDSRLIINKNTKKIHTTDCPLTDNISNKNKDYTTLTLSQLEKQGYTPCKSCNPHG